MIPDAQKRIVEAATVTVFTKDRGTGLGFLVAGGLIVTAAHCVDFDIEGQMALGDYYLQSIETSDGRRFLVSPLFVEPVSDLAVFGSADDQEFSEDAQAFERFVESITPIPVAMDLADDERSVSIFSHERKWLDGTASGFQSFSRLSRTLFVTAKAPVLGGTSGSAILNDDGAAISVVSVFSHSNDNNMSEGPNPIIGKCLSRVLLDIITECA